MRILREFGVSWDGLWRLLLGSHNFIVMVLGSCVRRHDYDGPRNLLPITTALNSPIGVGEKVAWNI